MTHRTCFHVGFCKVMSSSNEFSIMEYFMCSMPTLLTRVAPRLSPTATSHWWDGGGGKKDDDGEGVVKMLSMSMGLSCLVYRGVELGVPGGSGEEPAAIGARTVDLAATMEWTYVF